MRRIILVLAVIVAACTAKPGAEIEGDLDRRIQAGGLSGAALADAYVDRGLYRAATKNPDGAIADFDAAIAAAPDQPEAYVWRGIVTGEKGDKAGARADYDRALAIDPDYWFAHGAIGLALAAAGDEDAALATLARALELGRPHSGEFFVREVRQSRITQLARKGPPARGTATQSLSVAVSDHLTLYRVVRAQIFLKRNDKEAALVESRDAVGLAPRSAVAQWSLVRILATLGQCEEAWRQMEAMGKNTGIYFYPPESKDDCSDLAKPWGG
jgi:tetratricopeptide (TPR) repeat protein